MTHAELEKRIDKLSRRYAKSRIESSPSNTACLPD
jgi:hypothetical protein